MTDNTSTPEPTQPAVSHPQNSPKRPRKHVVLLSVAGVVAALALVGGGVAVGAAIADDDGDDRDDVAESTQQTSDETVRGSSSADELIDIVQSASASTDGVPTALEASRDGSWLVQFTTDAGDESDVRVSADGTATVGETDPAGADDVAPTTQLDDTTVRALVDAALAAADGAIVSLDVDDNPADSYEATILGSNGTLTELSLDGSFAVTNSETDNND
ncbi:hypothetical protein [Microbacterium pygmaeum]|uniref:Peptidase propeptide and YPEB domain-containing protein n=1 Tax=Microbacterium pygmaeum TaxID=370764 RepID=A0A1G7Y3I7_9MICO|nr:hypothetical protein [Microbacterium pygmaeum]SDG90974.1 hypothetical protein SAMN04489810_1622 [Microbacterium pygmaeum]